MALTNGSIPVDQWVNEQEGRVSRHIFSDPDIYQLEIERIFNKAWLYLGHETEIPNPGDYVTRQMGDDHVILNRGDDGKVRAFLNSCLHRGAQLCRAQTGCATAFVCPYHSWIYDSQGRLLRTSFDQYYAPGELDGIKLTEVAQLDAHHGLIFATWDPKAPPLKDWLGDLRWYLDILVGRTAGGLEVLAPPQRSVIETNWKLISLNFLDSQHAVRTHVGPLQLAAKHGAGDFKALYESFASSPGVSLDNGHGLVVIPFPPGYPEFLGLPPELVPAYRDTLEPAQFDLLKNLFAMVGCIFPNTTWLSANLMISAERRPAMFLTLRTFQPLGPDKVELWNWILAEKEMPQEWKDQALAHGMGTFSATGIYEEDDAVVWSSIVKTTSGHQARRQSMHFGAGLGSPPRTDFPGPGVAFQSQFQECQQMATLSCWKRMLAQAD